MASSSSCTNSNARARALPRSLPYRRQIECISQKRRIPYLASATLLGRGALLPLLRYYASIASTLPMRGAQQALVAAVHRDCSVCVEALIISAGGNPFCLLRNTAQYGPATATHIAAAHGKCAALATILRLDRACRATHVVDEHGLAPVHVAAALGNAHAVKLLVRHDAAALNVRGMRVVAHPLQEEYGAGNGMEQFDELPLSLSDQRFDSQWCLPREKSADATPLHMAAANGHCHVITGIARLAHEAELKGRPVRVLSACRQTRKRPRAIKIVSKEERCDRSGHNCRVAWHDCDYDPYVDLPGLQIESLRVREGSFGNAAPQVSASLRAHVTAFVSAVVEDCVKSTTVSMAYPQESDVEQFQLRKIRVQDVLEARNAQNNTALVVAASCGQEHALRTLLKVGADINARGFDMRTALHLAAEYNFPDLAESLIKDLGLCIDEGDEWGCTPLHIAAHLEDTGHVTERLIALGADVHARTYYDDTPLHFAARKANTAPFKKLLAAGATMDVICELEDPHSPLFALAMERQFELLTEVLEEHVANRRDVKLELNRKFYDGWSLLCECVGRGADARLVKALLDAGSDVNSENKHGSTPVTLAAEYCDEEVLKILLAKGAEANHFTNRGWSALHIAVGNNDNVKVAQTLLEYGADVNAVSNRSDGKTPLHVAAKSASAEKLRALLSAGAKCEMKTNFGKRTPLYYATQRCKPVAVKVLLHAGADTSAKDLDGFAPLHVAAGKSSAEIAHLLLRHAADLHARTNTGLSALRVAAKKVGRDANRLVQLLLVHGADVNEVDIEGNTPLHSAASRNSFLNLCTLLRYNADLQLRNRLGEDALLVAAKNGSLDSVVALLRHGASINTRDANDRLPVHIAAAAGHSHVVQYLLQRDSAGRALSSASLVLAAEAGRYGTVRMLLRKDARFLDPLAERFEMQIQSPCAVSVDEECERLHEEICEMDEERATCAICKALLRNRDVLRKLACGHTFHENCVLAWLTADASCAALTCPVCRQTLKKREDPEQCEHREEEEGVLEQAHVAQD